MATTISPLYLFYDLFFFPVISQQTLKERLDSIGRQLGMSTSIQEQKVSLSSDAFHVDVLLDGDNITSVKLANQGDVVVSCLLTRQTFHYFLIIFVCSCV